MYTREREREEVQTSSAAKPINADPFSAEWLCSPIEGEVEQTASGWRRRYTIGPAVQRKGPANAEVPKVLADLVGTKVWANVSNANGTAGYVFRDVVNAFSKETSNTPFPLSGGVSSKELYDSFVSHDVIKDNPTENFKARIAAGEVINQPVSNHKLAYHKKIDVPKLKPQMATVRASDTGYNFVILKVEALSLSNSTFDFQHRSFEADVLASIRSVVPDTSIDQLSVINKSFSKLNDGALALAVELGEGRETFAYVVTVARRVANLIFNVRNGSLKGFAQSVPKTYKKLMRKAKRLSKKNGRPVALEAANLIFDFAAEAWLEVRFAIRPLLIAAEQAVKLHNETILRDPTPRITSNSRRLKPLFKSWTETSLAESGHTITDTYSVVSESKTCAGVLADIDLSTAAVRELGFTNLAGTAWELTFLSWALDYFVNTDGLFYQITPNLGVRPLAGWLSVRTTIKGTCRRVYTDAEGQQVLKLTIDVNDELYDRVIVDRPTFVHLDIDLSMPKIIDLVALIKVLTSSNPKSKTNLLNYGVFT